MMMKPHAIPGWALVGRLAAAMASLLLATQTSPAVTYPTVSATEFPSGVYTDGNPMPMVYRYHLPTEYAANPTKKYPLVIFLHGSGEKGNDNQAQLGANANGSMVFIAKDQPKNDLNFPCLWVAPQCNGAGWDSPAYLADQVIGIVNDFITNRRADPNRVYLTGLSMGAEGVSYLLQYSPNTWAAAHVSTGWSVGNDESHKNIPLWAFDSEGDPGNGWAGPVDNLRWAGGAPTYTHYIGGGHSDTWTRAYDPNGPLVPWMMAQVRGQATPPNATPYISGAWSYTGPTANFTGTTGDSTAQVTGLTWRNLDTGDSGNATGSSTWSANVPLRNGTNRVTVTATGASYGSLNNGNTTFTKVFNVTYPPGDTVPPTLAISSPTSGATYSTAATPLTIGGAASDNVALASVTWSNDRGGNGTAAGLVSWSVGGIALVSGTNVITVKATDTAGLFTTKTLTVNYTGSPINHAPVVDAGADQVITLPAIATINAQVTDDGLPTASYTTQWTATGPGPVSFANAAAKNTTAMFTVPGVYTLRLTATDAAPASGFDDVTVTVNPASGLWATADIGSPAPAGSYSSSGGVLSVQGSGADIWGTSDQFRFVYQQINGDATIIARVDSLGATNGWAKAAVMIRSSLAANSPHAMMTVSPTSGAGLMYRTAAGATTQAPLIWGASPPVWLKLERVGDIITGSLSSDGGVWTPISSATVPLGTSTYVGLAVCSHAPGVLTTAAFSSVTITTPYVWNSSDIGGPAPAGSSNLTGDTFTLQAGGADIWGFSDAFRFTQQTLTGDGRIVARVTGLGNSNNWAKAGVMIRGSLAANSAHAMVCLNPVGVGGLMYRPSDGANTGQGNLVAMAIPQWISLTRTGSQITGASSVDNINWTPLGTVTVTLPQTVYIGLCLTSHNNGVSTTGTFTGVTITGN